MHKVIGAVDNGEITSQELKLLSLQVVGGHVIAIKELFESGTIGNPCEGVSKKETSKFFDGPSSGFCFSCTGMLVRFRGILKSM